MIRRRTYRVTWHALVFALLIGATVAAVRFLWNTAAREGMGPGTFFGLLLVLGGLLLTWWSYRELRRVIRRYRR